jgi:cytochrome P450
MSNAPPTLVDSKSTTNATQSVVDADLLRIIKNPEAPQGVPPIVKPPSTLPGRVGIFDGLTAIVRAMREGVAYAVESHERFGEIYQTPLVGNPMVAVWNADEIHRILKNEDQVWSAAMGWDILMFRGLDPQSANLGALLSRDFDDHRSARKLVQPAFTLKATQGYLAIAERSYERTVPRWIERGRIDFKPEIRTLLARVAGEIFTGIRDPAQIKVIDRALSDFWRGFLAAFKNPWLSPTFRRSQRGFAILMKSFLDLVPERRRSGGDDLFSQMCQVDDTDGLSDEAMVRVFLNVMFGAFDTTSAGVTSMAYLLAKHPEWQERLRDEAMALPAEPLDVPNLKKLRQLEWVWKETLRLMPVSSFVPRRALRSVEVCGYQLAAGTLVAPMVNAIGRHPRWWKDPTRFDPERFSPERAEDKQHPAIFLPFGAGAHACVGMQLSTMKVKVFWHKVLTSCRFALAKDYEGRHTNAPMGCVSGKVTLKLEPLARPRRSSP